MAIATGQWLIATSSTSKSQFERGLDQPATGSSRAAEKICTITVSREPSRFHDEVCRVPAVVFSFKAKWVNKEVSPSDGSHWLFAATPVG